MILEPQYSWNIVAEFQARAWRELSKVNPDYKSSDVEENYWWRCARELADAIIEN